jgi:hypothetical protein
VFTLKRGEHMKNFSKDEQKSTCTMDMPKIKNLKPFDFITTFTTKTFLQESNHNVKGDFAHVKISSKVES